MGEKGAQMTNKSVEAAEKQQSDLAGLGEIQLKKMFGGHGIFEDGKMFALVDKDGGIYFKVDQTNLEQYETKAAMKHGRMPYYLVPEQVLGDRERLEDWAGQSIQVARK